MPGTSKVIRRLKRPLFRKRRKKATISTTQISRPLGQKFIFKTRYFDNIELNATTGGIPSAYVFRLNSLYDVDYTSLGHQPMGFDQIMPLYFHYTVNSVKITLLLSNHDNDYDQLIVAQVKGNFTSSLNIPEIIENSNSKWTVLSTKRGGQAVTKMTINVNMRKYFGRTNLDMQYSGTESSSPIEQVYLHLVAGPLESIDANKVHVSILLEYNATLTEPKQLGQS